MGLIITFVLVLFLFVVPKFLFPFLIRKNKEKKDREFAENCRLYKERFLLEQERTRFQKMLAWKILYEQKTNREFLPESHQEITDVKSGFAHTGLYENNF